MMDSCVDQFSYFGNNLGMTLMLKHPSSSGAVDWQNSQSLARQLVQAIALPVDLKSRPLHHFESGRTLVKTGDVVARLPFVMSGRLNAVVHISGTQSGQIVPIAFGSGEIALLSYLFNRLPSGSDLVASQASAIQWIPIDEVESALLKDPQLMAVLVRFLGLRLREGQARERAASSRSVLTRLSASMSRILAVLPARPDARLLIHATHEQLASSCGVSRPKTSLALKKMERDGIILLGRKWVEVLDATALRTLSA
jgi:CRP-like cAMP-binding protein